MKKNKEHLLNYSVQSVRTLNWNVNYFVLHPPYPHIGVTAYFKCSLKTSLNILLWYQCWFWLFFWGWCVLCHLFCFLQTASTVETLLPVSLKLFDMDICKSASHVHLSDYSGNLVTFIVVISLFSSWHQCFILEESGRFCRACLISLKRQLPLQNRYGNQLVICQHNEALCSNTHTTIPFSNVSFRFFKRDLAMRAAQKHTFQTNKTSNLDTFKRQFGEFK